MNSREKLHNQTGRTRFILQHQFDAQIDRVDGTQDIDHTDDISQPDRITVQVPHGRTKADTVVQHDPFVYEQCCRENNEDRKDSPVAQKNPGRRKKQDCRKQIAFMHFDAENVEKNIQ